MTMPLCTAPFHSVLIDTDKTVKPCCAWEGPALGDLKTTPINEILNSDVLKSLQAKMLKGEWPDECLRCKEREEMGVKSSRLSQYTPMLVPYQGNTNLTYIEYNSSNLCNLVCVGCNPSASSAWEEFRKDVVWWKDFRKENGWVFDDFLPTTGPVFAIHPPRIDFVKEFVTTVDLSKLTFVTFKGGEPFLNKENISLLEHLDNIGVLSNIRIFVFTNGTFSNEAFLNLCKKAREVRFFISLDAVSELNQYIRFDPKNPEKSHTDEIKKNILKYIKLPNAQVGVTPSIQAHNIFNLEDLRKFWVEEICLLDEVKIQKEIPFTHFILWPQECAISVYSDATRHKLADYYESLNLPHIYSIVINALRLPYAGDKWHNQFVKYTQALDKTRLATFVELVSEAADEMILL